jgi:hypothetical protein
MGGDEKGAGLLSAVLTVFVGVGLGAVAVDLGYMAVVKNILQVSADAAATAAVYELPVTARVRKVAVAFANENSPWDDKKGVLDRKDVEVGHWSDVTHTFSAAGPPNAVRVVTKHDATLLFARGLGFGNTSAIAAVAVATRPRLDGGGDARFLVDQEMIDNDIPEIEDLARRLGKTPEEVISDLDPKDWFIDLPPGEVLELPTGQVGDPGLLEVKPGLGFPFSQESDPSLADFLNYNEDSSSSRYDLVPKEMLDPLEGVIYVEDGARYPEFVNPAAILVSPVYKSDVNQINPQDVNALGERRGLLAFSIIGIGRDPDGDGSVLPNIIIQVRDPTGINLDDVAIGSGGQGGVGGLVRLVR